MNPDPDYSMGKEEWSAWIAVMGVTRFSLQVTGLSGVVKLQGNNGNPAEAGEWYDLETLNADGEAVVAEEAVSFIRVNKSTHTSGTVTCVLTLES
jgi:hypothetical protein